MRRKNFLKSNISRLEMLGRPLASASKHASVILRLSMCEASSSVASVGPAPTTGHCRSAMEIACQTDVEYDTVIFNWRVNNFQRMRSMAREKGEQLLLLMSPCTNRISLECAQFYRRGMFLSLRQAYLLKATS